MDSYIIEVNKLLLGICRLTVVNFSLDCVRNQFLFIKFIHTPRPLYVIKKTSFHEIHPN